MGFWDAIKKLVTEGSVSYERSSVYGTSTSTSKNWSSSSSITDSSLSTTDTWGSSSGSVMNSQQSIELSVSERGISGNLSGEIGKLSGSTFVELNLEDYASGRIPVSVKAVVKVIKGQVQASIRTIDGEIISKIAADEGAEISSTSSIDFGNLRFKLEALDSEAINIQYLVEFSSL
ncbi:hypothetical protein [Calothrix sp. PCC 7507]|uniref:hypothetical protein n=1 Tax=Calothrix sp. PCC 7507 TaxID=99598 RepID=UPI00029F2894|nr:hypothetical protein [Calothrix sp. PCC 7507]AFY34646.1 hypothetical protein Cal7507_4270 [Calothrix sp. PCC 7507]